MQANANVKGEGRNGDDRSIKEQNDSDDDIETTIEDIASHATDEIKNDLAREMEVHQSYGDDDQELPENEAMDDHSPQRTMRETADLAKPNGNEPREDVEGAMDVDSSPLTRPRNGVPHAV